MTKVKLKDAIKDLTTDAAKVRDDASRVRQSADGLAKSLRALENGFIKSLNAKAEPGKARRGGEAVSLTTPRRMSCSTWMSRRR